MVNLVRVHVQIWPAFKAIWMVLNAIHTCTLCTIPSSVEMDGIGDICIYYKIYKPEVAGSNPAQGAVKLFFLEISCLL